MVGHGPAVLYQSQNAVASCPSLLWKNAASLGTTTLFRIAGGGYVSSYASLVPSYALAWLCNHNQASYAQVEFIPFRVKMCRYEVLAREFRGKGFSTYN